MAVRRLILCIALVACVALAGPAWAGNFSFHGNAGSGQGELSFAPGVGHALSIGSDGVNPGALITDLFTNNLCFGDCGIVGGYMTLTSGVQLACSPNPCTTGSSFLYSFASGGTMSIFGKMPQLGINVSTLLFSATFLNATWTGGGAVGSYTAGINLASIVLAPQLGMYHFNGGVNNDISFSIDQACSTGGICSGLIVQSDTTLQTIPEPATLSVLGVGLFAFGTGLRRKMTASSRAA